MNILTIVLLVVAIVLALVGIVGAIIPALPGPPISWLALLIAFFAVDNAITSATLWMMLALTVVVTILDYFAPAMMTKLGGGSKAASSGATIGTIVGLFLAPWGLLLGPLVGAFLGEYLHEKDNATNRFAHSLRVGALSFVGFLLTTGMKLITCLRMFWLIISVLF